MRHSPPRIVALAALQLLIACGQPAEPPYSSAILITLDTTNALALDMYGEDRGLTPSLSQLASDGVIFDSVRTVAPITLPAHASMFTGLYPPRHGVRVNGHLPVPAAAETLAERAHAAGFRTAAFVAAEVLAAPYGLNQGFEVYDDAIGRKGPIAGGVPQRSAHEVTRAAIAWLDSRNTDRPFLLWVHYFDPHAPYSPSPEDLQRAGGRKYLAEVAGVDRQVGILLERLAQEPDHERAIIAVVADHGESLGRHGELTHSLLTYDTTMHVPLILRLPGKRRAGERSSEVASVVDLYPTLAEAMGLMAPTTAGEHSDIDGRSLLTPASNPHRGVYFESYCGYLNYGWSPLTGWFDGEMKFIHGPEPELYAVTSDPSEEKNLFAPEHPGVVRARRSIERLAQQQGLARGANESLAVADQTRLRALGYAGSASVDAVMPDPLELVDLPSPRTRMPEYELVMDALRLVEDDQLEQAIQQLRGVADENPRNAFAHDLLGQCLIDAGRAREALAPLEAMLALGLDRPSLRSHLASAHASLGQLDVAIEHLRQAEAMSPNDPKLTRTRKRFERLLQDSDRGGALDQ